MKIQACLTNKSDLWKTPTQMYNWYIKNGYFDPCPTNPQFDGLQIDWQKLNFVNPPYSQIEKWIEKALKEKDKGHESVLLIPARTDTKWFKKLVDNGATIRFIQGRLHFNDSLSAPFPSMLVTIYKYCKKNQPTFDYIAKNNRYWEIYA